MRRLHLQCEHKPLEPRDEAPLVGEVRVEQGEARGVLLTPEPYDPSRLYPLFTVFHGAGRQDELLRRACQRQPNERQAFFFIPRSVAPTWDLIVEGPPVDVEFLEYGTHDQLFSFEEIALPMRENLERAGHDVTFSVDEGGRHMPSGSFQREALDWYFEAAAD